MKLWLHLQSGECDRMARGRELPPIVCPFLQFQAAKAAFENKMAGRTVKLIFRQRTGLWVWGLIRELHRVQSTPPLSDTPFLPISRSPSFEMFLWYEKLYHGGGFHLRHSLSKASCPLGRNSVLFLHCYGDTLNSLAVQIRCLNMLSKLICLQVCIS